MTRLKRSMKFRWILPGLLLLVLCAQVPAMARYTSLVVDARDVDLSRSMSPRIYSESGRELYGSVPPGSSDRIMEKQSFLYAFSLEEAMREDNSRIGANPLILQAVGAKLGDVYISDSAAQRADQEEKTGLFFKNQNVVVLVKKPELGERPVELGGAQESGTVSALRDRLAKMKARRMGGASSDIQATIDRPFDTASLPGQTAPATGARVVVNPSETQQASAVTEDMGGDIQLASVVKIRGQKILLQRLDDKSQIRINSKFRVYRSIIKNSSVGWVKIIRAEGTELEGRIVEGDDAIKVGDYIDLAEENTIDNYLKNFK